MLAGACATAGSGVAVAAPSIGELRAQVARIQAEVASIDDQVGDAAEAYNGAVWRLQQVQQRIARNRETLRTATRDLALARGALANRLSAAYRKPAPTRLQLILSTRTLSGMLGGVQALDRASARDGVIIRGIQRLRARTIAARAELVRDRRTATAEVAVRARQRDVVTALLRRRQAVLSQAKGRLGTLLAEQRAREARAQAAAQRLALQRARAANARPSSPAPVPAPSSPAPGAPALSTPAPAVESGAASAANAQAARVALRYLGVPYRWGGASPSSGFDCSGLASYAYAQVGKSVPHYTGAIWAAFPKVSSLQPGDLVFFRGLGHMGIYIGGGQMVHAPRTGDVVKITAMSSRSDYVGAVRP